MIPNNINEAHLYLEEHYRDIFLMTDYKELWSYHHSLGRWMRNMMANRAYFYGNGRLTDWSGLSELYKNEVEVRKNKGELEIPYEEYLVLHLINEIGFRKVDEILTKYYGEML